MAQFEPPFRNLSRAQVVRDPKTVPISTRFYKKRETLSGL